MTELAYVATADRLEQVQASINSVLLHPPYPDQIVIYTDQLEIHPIQNRGTIPIRIQPIEKLIPAIPHGNKICICNSDADITIYLDNDTIVNQSLKSLVSISNHDWEFRARIGTIFENGTIPQDKWRNFFETRGLIPKPMWNSGVLCLKSPFKNSLGESWKKWFLELSTTDFSDVCDRFFLDQISLSMAVSETGGKVLNLEMTDHSYEWMAENPYNSSVHHTGSLFYQRALLRNRIIDSRIGHLLGRNSILFFENSTRRLWRRLKG